MDPSAHPKRSCVVRAPRSSLRSVVRRRSARRKFPESRRSRYRPRRHTHCPRLPGGLRFLLDRKPTVVPAVVVPTADARAEVGTFTTGHHPLLCLGHAIQKAHDFPHEPSTAVHRVSPHLQLQHSSHCSFGHGYADRFRSSLGSPPHIPLDDLLCVAISPRALPGFCCSPVCRGGRSASL